MKTPPIVCTHDVAAKGIPPAANQLRSHSHGHGSAHTHSHGSIEKNVSGRFLRQCQIATLVGGATNIFFCVTKLWIGSAGGSVALVADGFHALTDILADIISYGAVSLSRKKLPRCRFPFGIGRLETSGAILVSAILFFGGVALLVQSLEQCLMDVSHLLAIAAPTGGIAAAVILSVRNALAAETSSASTDTEITSGGGDSDSGSHGDTVDHSHSHGAVSVALADNKSSNSHGHSHFEVTQFDEATGRQIILWTMVCIAAASVVTKELLFRWTRRVGLRAGSRVVVANAYHHRADAWSGGVALIGVAGHVVGIPGIDGLAGLAVSLSICKIGYGLFRDAVLEFFDYQSAEEVSAIREQLQEFTLRIDHGKHVVPAMTEVKKQEAAAAVEEKEGALSESTSSVTMSDDPEAVDRKKILFMNVFLVRHGHKYALHVTLLVYETVQATQIREATDLLTALARGSLPVQDTFTNILVCSNYTEKREEYLGTDHAAVEETEDREREKGTAGKLHMAAVAPAPVDSKEPSHRHSYGKDKSSSGSSRDDDVKASLYTAATGDIINPSLERCIASLEAFHTFTSHIRYNWEERTITAPTSDSCECDRDIASVADMFRCRQIGGNTTHEEAEEAEGAASTHGHSHDEDVHHTH